MFHPVATEVFTPVPKTHLNCTFCPAAFVGKVMLVVTHPAELPPQADTAPNGLPVPEASVTL